VNRYAKLIPPLVGAVVMAFVLTYQEVSSDTAVSASEWVLVVIQVLAAVSVWGAVNVPGWTKGKTVQMVVFTVLGLLVSLITDGLTSNEIMQLVVLALSTAGVAGVRQPLSQVGYNHRTGAPSTRQDSPPRTGVGW